MAKLITLYLFLLAVFLSGCTGNLFSLTNSKGNLRTATQTRRLATMPSPDRAAAQPDSTAPSPPQVTLRLQYDASVPAGLRKQAQFPPVVKVARKGEEAHLEVRPVDGQGLAKWVYALVAPFPTVTDGVALGDLKKTWKGQASGALSGHKLLVAASTRAAFETIWGGAAEATVETAPEDVLLEKAWSEQSYWALVPFEAIGPRWKVLRVNGMSPLDRAMQADQYPLTLEFGLTGTPEALRALEAAAPGVAWLPGTNRDPEQMTVLLMTGVTALVRATGAKMEAKGMTYPAKDILDWFRSADLRHISNEIPFSPYCPKANAYQDTLQFCSRPEYAQLLEEIGVNVIEMTGNHLLDWNADSLEYTFQLYRDHGWPYYAAGENLEEARKPLLIEDHGNKIAFIGCNPAGPAHDWAKEDSPGAAPCDFEWMEAEIGRLRDEGYLPVATMQYFEYYTPEARPWQVEDFERLSKAGAVIVSGSQAHTPQAFGFVGDNFIHYGLGNLFFDQMDVPVPGTRREFLDRHVFYNGRYLGVDLLTAMLEEYARPRPMTSEERVKLLQDMFDASVW